MELGHVYVTSVCALLFILMTSSQCVAEDIISEGPESHGDECCAGQLIDSSRERVVLETSRAIDEGRYRAVRLRLCTIDQLSVQLWRRVASTTYQLYWQTPLLTPTARHTNLSYVTVKLSSPVDITVDDRVGVYTNSPYHLPVPFQQDHTASLYYSTDVILNNTFSESQKITVDSSRWRRSFRKYVVFCQTADCSEVPDSPPRLGIDVNTAYCCQPETALSCVPSPDVTEEMSRQKTYMEIMRDTVSQLNDILTSIVSQNYVTGLCPQGFLSGSYGVGSCYLMFTNPVPMAQAVLTCRGYGALLLTIETGIEQQFIKNFVQNNTIPGDDSVIQFWTTGMYNPDREQWFWYAGTSNQLTTFPDSVTTKRIAYSHWRNGTAPTPRTVNDVCLTVAVDRQRNIDYWTNEFCYRKLSTICEIPKRCL